MTNDNKKLISGIIVAALIIVVIIGITLACFGMSGNNNGNNSSNGNNTSNNNTSVSYIGEESAKNIAFSDAGIAQADANGVTCNLEKDNDIMIYDISFNANGTEYDYEVDATSGNILEKDTDVKNTVGNTIENTTTTLSRNQKKTASNINESTGSVITEDKAKSIAFKDANISENNATNIVIHKETDDGVGTYEVKFIVNGYEYEYEINSASGEIIEKNKEIID